MKSHPHKKQSVLVTGAAGFIAFHLIESLLKSGVAVVGVDNFDSFYSRQRKESNTADLLRLAKQTGGSFTFIEKDICTPFENFENQTHFSAIYHLAAKAGVRPSLQDPQGYLLTNELGTLQMLEFARKRGIENFIFASSSSVYGNDTAVPFSESAPVATPFSPYAASKRCGEIYCRTYSHLYGMRIACMRLFTVYGPRQRPDLAIHKFAKQILNNEQVTLFGDGTSERDYTFVTDTVNGLRKSLQWLENSQAGTCEVFNLGAGHSTPLKRLLELIEASLGVRADIAQAPLQPGEVFQTLANNDKALRILGYTPTILPSEGIPLFTQWFRETSQQKHTNVNQAA